MYSDVKIGQGPLRVPIIYQASTIFGRHLGYNNERINLLGRQAGVTDKGFIRFAAQEG